MIYTRILSILLAAVLWAVAPARSAKVKRQCVRADPERSRVGRVGCDSMGGNLAEEVARCGSPSTVSPRIAVACAIRAT